VHWIINTVLRKQRIRAGLQPPTQPAPTTGLLTLITKHIEEDSDLGDLLDVSSVSKEVEAGVYILGNTP
jgi:hypothetical protein